MFFNTTKMGGEDLKFSTYRAASQTLAILKFFASNAGNTYTPIEVHKALGETFLLTSVRRSMSVLTKDNYLIKTGMKAIEMHGAENYKWTFNIDLLPQRQTNLFT